MIFSSMDQCIVSFCLSMRSQVAPLPRSSRSARVASPGCPFPAPFLLSRRPNPRVAPRFRAFGRAGDGSFESPQTSMPLALPVSAKFRVAPLLPPSPAPPAMEDSGRPLSCISGFTGDGSSSCPDARIIRRCRPAGSQVAPSSGPSVSPTIRCSSCPER